MFAVLKIMLLYILRLLDEIYTSLTRAKCYKNNRILKSSNVLGFTMINKYFFILKKKKITYFGLLFKNQIKFTKIFRFNTKWGEFQYLYKVQFLFCHVHVKRASMQKQDTGRYIQSRTTTCPFDLNNVHKKYNSFRSSTLNNCELCRNSMYTGNIS